MHSVIPTCALCTAVLVSMCADGPSERTNASPLAPWLIDDDEDDIILGGSGPINTIPTGIDEDDMLLGTPVSWPFGMPTLRTEMHLRRQQHGGGIYIAGPTLAELRRRRAAEAAEAEAETLRLLRSAGLRAAQAKGCLRKAPGLRRVRHDILRARLDCLRAILPPRATTSVLRGAPSLLIHTQFNASLHSKFRQLQRVTGLSASRIAIAAPSLLHLDAGGLATRVNGMQAALPGVQVSVILRRAPRLLSSKPETLRANFAALAAVLPPPADAAAIVERQPTLLGSSPDRLAEKIDLLEELTSEGERAALIGSPASFARTLTASLEVIGRLRVDHLHTSGSPRGITSIIFMPKRQWQQRQQNS